MENPGIYIGAVAIVFFLAARAFRQRRIRMEIPAYLKNGAQIVDVRSLGEYAAGHAPGSINIPLGDLATGSGVLSKEKPVLLCCASGARSGMAVAILKGLGFKEVINAGPWQNTVSSK